MFTRARDLLAVREAVLSLATPANMSSNAAPTNKFEAMKQSVHDFLHEKNSFTYMFELAEKYTKMQREYIFIGEGDSRAGGGLY